MAFFFKSGTQWPELLVLISWVINDKIESNNGALSIELCHLERCCV